jgi:flagellar assembly protein FliH
MTKTQPFTFDRAFDREGPGATGPRAPQKKLLSLDEIEQLKRDAHAAGMKAADQGHAKRSADALGIVAQKIDVLGGALEAALAPARADAAILAYVTAVKLAKVLIGSEPEAEIRALIAQCIAEQAAEPHLVLRVNDTLHDPMREMVTKLTETRGFAGRVHVIGEPQIQAGDCHIEWADGGLERNLSGALAEIEETIRNYVARMGGKDALVPTPETVMADPESEEAPADAQDQTNPETQLSIEGL